MPQVRIKRVQPRKITPIKPVQQGGQRPASASMPPNMKAVQDFQGKQRYVIGQDFAMPVGSDSGTIKTMGKVGILRGINIYTTAGEVKFTLKVNMNDVISTSNTRFYNPNFNFTTKGQDFFDVNQVLSGSDEVIIEFTSTAAGRLYIDLYIYPTN